MCRVVLVVISLALSSITQTAKPVELPKTPQGEIVAGYFKAFNSGDEKMMRDFFTNNVSAGSLAERPVEARLEFYRQMRADMGKLEVRRVLSARDNEISVLVQTSARGWLELGFIFESTPPKLAGLRVEDTDPAGPVDETDDLPPTMTEARFVEVLGKQLDQAAAADELSGAVLVARKNDIVFQKAYGLASKEYNVPNRVDTRFNLGSINKIFTQIAIGQLIEQGKLSLDDKLGRLLPDYPNREAADKVTVRQLLDMRSGIGDFFGPEFQAKPKNRLRTVNDFLPLFAAKPLLFEPGSKQQYSNGGYVVLGAIVEKVSGMSYYDYVRQHVFVPAGMRDTDYYEADAVVANLAGGYTRQGSSNGARRNNIYSRPARGSSAGGGYSTAPDLLKFVNALREGKLRIPDFRGEQRAPAQRGSGFDGFGIAGGAPGINAALETEERSGYAVIVLTNYDPPNAERMARKIRGWIDRIRN